MKQKFYVLTETTYVFLLHKQGNRERYVTLHVVETVVKSYGMNLKIETVFPSIWQFSTFTRTH